MLPDFTPIFARYEALRNKADALFARVREAHPECVSCKEGCSDCCHALFDLSLVEAMYLHRAFEASIGYGPVRSAVIARAVEADRQAARIKRELFRAEKDGENPATIMERAAQIKLRCPLLDDDDRCLLYAARPVTCRVYGVPTAIGGQGHVCGFSRFEKGRAYPTIHMDRIQDMLNDLSRAIGEAAHSRFDELHATYVPLSMALLTRYDAAYLGIGPAPVEG